MPPCRCLLCYAWGGKEEFATSLARMRRAVWGWGGFAWGFSNHSRENRELYGRNRNELFDCGWQRSLGCVGLVGGPPRIGARTGGAARADAKKEGAASCLANAVLQRSKLAVKAPNRCETIPATPLFLFLPRSSRRVIRLSYTSSPLYPLLRPHGSPR